MEPSLDTTKHPSSASPSRPPTAGVTPPDDRKSSLVNDTPSHQRSWGTTSTPSRQRPPLRVSASAPTGDTSTVGRPRTQPPDAPPPSHHATLASADGVASQRRDSASEARRSDPAPPLVNEETAEGGATDADGAYDAHAARSPRAPSGLMKESDARRSAQPSRQNADRRLPRGSSGLTRVGTLLAAKQSVPCLPHAVANASADADAQATVHMHALAPRCETPAETVGALGATGRSVVVTDERVASKTSALAAEPLSVDPPSARSAQTDGDALVLGVPVDPPHAPAPPRRRRATDGAMAVAPLAQRLETATWVCPQCGVVAPHTLAILDLVIVRPGLCACHAEERHQRMAQLAADEQTRARDAERRTRYFGGLRPEDVAWRQRFATFSTG